MNAVIVDLKGKYAAALDESGAIVKIPNANYTIGQKIQLHELQHRRRAPSLKRIAAVALAASLILSIGMGTAYALPYGTVSLDADAAIEYTINRFDRVLSVKALNEEGEAVLSELDPGSLRFRPVEQAITLTLEAPELSGEEAPPLRITASTGNDRHSERLQERLTERFPGGDPPPDTLSEPPQFQGNDSLPREEGGMPEPHSNPDERQAQVPQERPALSGEVTDTAPEAVTAPDAGRQEPQEPASGLPEPAMGPPEQNAGMPEIPQPENGAVTAPQQGAFGMPEPGGPPQGR